MTGDDDKTPTQPIRIIPVYRPPAPRWGRWAAAALVGAVVLGLLALAGCAPTAKLVLRCAEPHGSTDVLFVYDVIVEDGQPALLVVPPRGCMAEVEP